MGIYEYIIKDKAGNMIASLDSAKNRSYGIYLNKSGDASFNVSPKDPKITQDLLLLGNKELFIYRYGKIVWGGELTTRMTSVSGNSEGISVTCKGFLELLGKKVIGSPGSPIVYSATDLSQIAWGAINTAQTGANASFGITQGALATSRNADRTIDDYKTVKEVVEGLSNLSVQNGIDFEVDANKQFSTYYPQKGRMLSDVIFEWGRNIDGFEETLDASNMANEMIVLGSGMGTEMLVATRDTAIVGVQDTYKIRQKILQHKDVVDTTTLNDHGDAELAKNQTQSQIISITTKGNLEPQIGAYQIGDSVRVRINYGCVAIDGYYRIYGIKVTVSDDDEETIKLTFNP